MRLPLHVFTIALDAMPWLACTFAELSKLTDVPWSWTIVEGAAMNVKDTSWMQSQAPRLSSDGTTEFLDAIASHPRIRVIRRLRWEGKVEMCNAAIEAGGVDGVLFQVDGDELWSADQFRRIVELFEDDPSLQMARFHCRYFVGPNIVTTDAGKADEWLRAWRFGIGMRFAKHEPPTLIGCSGKSLHRLETARMGLVFDHHAYTLPKHVAMKEKLYGPKYKGAVAGWSKLQANPSWPVKDLGVFLPPAFKGCPADRVF